MSAPEQDLTKFDWSETPLRVVNVRARRVLLPSWLRRLLGLQTWKRYDGIEVSAQPPEA